MPNKSIIKHAIPDLRGSPVSPVCCRHCKPKVLGGAKYFWLQSEQHYFVWDTAYRSTKRQNIPKIWRTMAPLAPLATLLVVGGS